jgi:SAM-dependent methyltransferase
MSRPLVSARKFAYRQMLRLKAWRRWREGDGGDPSSIPPGASIPFLCNLCATPNEGTLDALSREALTCTHCGSNVRFRAMAYLVTREVLGRPLLLPDVPLRKDIAGIGLSDAEAYARPLAEKFSYENTFFHTEPRLDIADIDATRDGRYDFLIASDVFEHVAPPVARAFANARRLLKPDGKLIFTVPFTLENDTIEHYPELFDWSMADQDGNWTLINRTRDGREQIFTDLVFHGGPGSTLEMRLFSRAALEREFHEAGFARVRIAAEPYLPFGIHWPEPWSVPMVAYADDN